MPGDRTSDLNDTWLAADLTRALKKVESYDRSRHRRSVRTEQENVTKRETTHRSRSEVARNEQKHRTSSTEKQNVKSKEEHIPRQGRSMDLAERYGVKVNSRGSHSKPRTQVTQEVSSSHAPKLRGELSRRQASQESAAKYSSKDSIKYSKSQPNLEKNEKLAGKSQKRHETLQKDLKTSSKELTKKYKNEQSERHVNGQLTGMRKHFKEEITAHENSPKHSKKTQDHNSYEKSGLLTGTRKHLKEEKISTHESSPKHSKKTQDHNSYERNSSARRSHSSKRSHHVDAASTQKDVLFKEDRNNPTQVKHNILNAKVELSNKHQPDRREEAEKIHKESDDEYNYEDDFEDYESDFEEDTEDENVTNEDDDEEEEEEEQKIDIVEETRTQNDNNKIEASILTCQPLTSKKDEPLHQPIIRQRPSSRRYSVEKAKMEENRLGITTIQTNFKREELSVAPPPRSFINFASAKHQQQKKNVINKVMKRGQEILELITLDEMYFDLFDMPPAKYDIYIRNFGRFNNKQVYVQTDNTEEEEIQTDEIEMRDKWTQHPAYRNLDVGGDFGPQNTSSRPWKDRFKMDILKLNKFVLNSGQLMLTLLSEEFAEVAPSKLTKAPHQMKFSQGYTKLPSTPFTKNSSVTYLSFSSISVNYLLTIHGAVASASLPDLEEKGIICVWNLNSPSYPENILTCTSQPTCCCFGPENIIIVIAGMVDGSVMLWDLREAYVWHQQIRIEEKEWILRSPTYSSASVLKEDGHHSSVVSLSTLVYKSSSQRNALSSGSFVYTRSTESFHVLTLEDLGVICVWVVVEIIDHDPTGSETDLGLAPWGRLKLVNSSRILLYTLPHLSDVLTIGLRTFDFQTLPSDPNHILVTTDAGLVLHCTRYSGKAKPRFFRPETDFIAKVRTIDCSVHDLPLFLVGCDDGSIRLHSVILERPVMVWPGASLGSPILKVQWSRTLPAVFFVLDASSYITVWDLTKDISLPIYSYQLTESGISTFSMSWLPQMAIALENGEIQVHRLHDRLIHISSEEYKQMQQFMLNL